MKNVSDSQCVEKSTTLADKNCGMTPTKYDLALSSLAKKCQALRKAKYASFNRKFTIQNKGFFGFIPISPLPEKIRDNSKPTNLSYQDIQNKLWQDGRPNFSGLQIPVKSKLNADKFFEYLHGY